MQVDLEAPRKLVTLLAARGTTRPTEPTGEQRRPALSVTAPNQPAVTCVVELDPARLVAAGTAIHDWWHSDHHPGTGTWRLAVYLRSGVWDSTNLRPSTRAGDIRRLLATLDLGATDSNEHPSLSTPTTTHQAPA